MRFSAGVTAAIVLSWTRFVPTANAQQAAAPIPEVPFAQSVAPFLAKHCNGCHGGDAPEAKLGLDRYTDSARIQTDFLVWEKVQRMVQARQMPPGDEPQPTQEEIDGVVLAIQAELNSFDCSSERHPGRVTIRRLNKVEYNNTVRDLVGIDFKPADDFPSDDVGNGFDNIGDVLSMPPVLMEKYLDASEKIIEAAFANPELKARLLHHKPDDPENSDQRRNATRANIRDFATKAFRRKLSDGDVDQLYALRRSIRSVRLSEEQSEMMPYKVILASPNFLFRVEKDPDSKDEDGIRALDSYELATRLSYFLWSTLPDDELFALAAKGELDQPEVLEAQVRRMLQHEKSRALIDNFAGQWLQLRDVRKVTPDPATYPGFDDSLREAMLRESQLFLETIVREDRSILDMLDADYTFVNERLARHYGIDGVAGEEFRKVSAGPGRRGLLTQASILTLTSNPTRTSPVKRGKWILENILGEPPPPPPPAVPELEQQELLGTLRERMVQHRENPSCAVCHTQMDTLGFGLENFDGIGAWRDRDGRFDIDPSGSLPGGQSFQNASELMNVLSQQRREAFCRCITEKMLTYALGRGLVSYDRCAVKEILARVESNDYHFSALVTGIVLSDPFRHRELPGDR